MTSSNAALRAVESNTTHRIDRSPLAYNLRRQFSLGAGVLRELGGYPFDEGNNSGSPLLAPFDAIFDLIDEVELDECEQDLERPMMRCRALARAIIELNEHGYKGCEELPLLADAGVLAADEFIRISEHRNVSRAA